MARDHGGSEGAARDFRLSWLGLLADEPFLRGQRLDSLQAAPRASKEGMVPPSLSFPRKLRDASLQQRDISQYMCWMRPLGTGLARAPLITGCPVPDVASAPC